MIERIDVEAFLEKMKTFLILDVRSPWEFEQGHIPGSYNIPLFSDQEREEIGMLYHHQGRQAAIIRGLDLCLPKAGRYIPLLQKISSSEDLLLYCWRGGMRSAMMAEVFSAGGYKAGILTGGYKSFRRHTRERLSDPARIIVLGGHTGSRKTRLLDELKKAGEQVIDLEELACHRGSVFGAFGQAPQPTNEQFENNLYSRWQELDLTRPVWLEDESRMIGNVTIPDPVIEKISKGRMVLIEVPHTIRIEHLVKEYSRFDRKELAAAIRKLRLRMGGTETARALRELEQLRFDAVAEILLSYYDKAYTFALERRKDQQIHKITLKGTDPVADAKKILRFSRNLPAG